MAELKPCPFCGATEELSIEEKRTQYIEWYYVYCGSCGSSGSMKFTEKEAISAWNKRS